MEVQLPAQGHIFGIWWSQGSKPDFSDLSVHIQVEGFLPKGWGKKNDGLGEPEQVKGVSQKK